MRSYETDFIVEDIGCCQNHKSKTNSVPKRHGVAKLVDQTLDPLHQPKRVSGSRLLVAALQHLHHRILCVSSCSDCNKHILRFISDLILVDFWFKVQRSSGEFGRIQTVN